MSFASLTLAILVLGSRLLLLFFFNDTATTEIYTLSLHDALPISTSPRSPGSSWRRSSARRRAASRRTAPGVPGGRREARSEEHTSELQSRLHLVCRLLLEKKKFSAMDENKKREIARKGGITAHRK